MLEFMKSRRSIRKYLDKPVETEKLDDILECALRSPSSRGKCPWKIWVLTDKEVLAKISEAKPHGLEFVHEAPAAFIVAGYPEKSDVWIEDCSIVSIIVQLEAESLGLGSCWGQIRNRTHDENVTSSDFLKGALGLDSDCEILSVIAVGYKGEDKPGHSEVPYDKSEILNNRMQR